MSRKPTAVSLDAPPPKAEETKDKTAKPASSEKRKPQSRKPRAMKAPDPGLADAFPDETVIQPVSRTHTHLPGFTSGSRWVKLVAGSLATLVMLGLGLWFTEVVEALFARHVWLGWGASALLTLAVVGILAILVREIVALWQLRALTRLREQVAFQLEGDAKPDPKLIDRIVGLYEDRPDMGWHISELAGHGDDVMDTRDRLLLAERYLMLPLDEEAKQIVAKAARRVSVVTAVNPAASLDVVFVAWQVLAMLRKLTALYGSRPGSLGTLRLARMVGSHLAVTGGLALSDTLLQQFIGKGLAGRLSAKLGEGTINGILTARIGIAAMDLCRPMPFHTSTRPGLKEFIGVIAGTIGNGRGGNGSGSHGKDDSNQDTASP
ncbi:MAG: TIGR01620 family protein [Pseudomonadota bacterium]